MSNVAKLEAQKSETPKESAPKRSILVAISERYNMEPAAFEATVRATCFPANPPATREEFAAGMQIAYRLELNPLTKEIHFARNKGGGIQGLIGIDGWFVMANRHPQYDGCEFEKTYETDKAGKKELSGITCRIFRKDRQRHTEVEELMVECRRPNSEAWKLTPSRMLRHRAFGQCARIAFSFVGVMDEDEYARWQEMKDITPKAPALAVPDLPDDATPTISEAESNQDAPIVNEPLYLEQLADQLATADNQELYDEAWAAHETLVEAGRLSREGQIKAQALNEQHAARFNTSGTT